MHVYIIYAYVYVYIYLFISIYKFNKYVYIYIYINILGVLKMGPPPTLRLLVRKNRLLCFSCCGPFIATKHGHFKAMLHYQRVMLV